VRQQYGIKKPILWREITGTPEPTKWRHLASWPITAQGHGETVLSMKPEFNMAGYSPSSFSLEAVEMSMITQKERD